MPCNWTRATSTTCSGHPMAFAAAAIFSMTRLLFRSLSLAISLRQFDIASSASLRASRAWFDRLGTELRSKLRDLSSSDFFGMAAFPFKSGDQLYLSGAARLPGGAEQETSLSSFQRGRATGERPDSFEPQLGSSGLAFL